MAALNIATEVVPGASVGEVVIRVDAAGARRLANAWASYNARADAGHRVPEEFARWHDDVVHLIYAAFAAEPGNTPIAVTLVDGQVPNRRRARRRARLGRPGRLRIARALHVVRGEHR